MNIRLASPARLLALFVLLSGIPLIALGWLGWRVLEQDRALDVQRSRDRLANAAGALTRALDRELAAWEIVAQQAADGGRPTPPAGTTLVIIDTDGTLEQYGVLLPYWPHVPAFPGYWSFALRRGRNTGVSTRRLWRRRRRLRASRRDGIALRSRSCARAACACAA